MAVPYSGMDEEGWDGFSPRQVTYSVSFCENLPSDRERLLSEDNDSLQEPIQEFGPPSSERVPVQPRPITVSTYSSSLPNHFQKDLVYSVQAGQSYGSLPGTASGLDPQRVIYCVHGKPGGCCARLVSDNVDQSSTTSITIVDDHCHKGREHGVDKKARRKLIIASILCVVFMIAEAVGGFISGSLAIATDAAHLLTDFAGFMISLFALWVAQRKPTRSMPFGWHRAEVIGALTSVVTIWVITGILVYLAIERCIHQDFEIDSIFMLITSGFGVLVNIIMGVTLHQHGHSHSHSHSSVKSSGHSHSSCTAHTENPQSPEEKEKPKNINVRAAFIHVIGDLIQSIGVFVAALIIYFQPSWVIVDPICTFLFSILVLATTFGIIKDALIVLMEGIPKDVDFNEVLETFLSIDGVVKVHNLRIWALSLDKTALSAHLAISPDATSEEILKIASRKVHGKYDFFEMTLQIEKFQPNMENCSQCQMPS